MRTEENHILRTLLKKEHGTLLPELRFVTLVFNQALYTAHAEIEYGYFMNTRLISCPTFMQNEAGAEVGLVAYQGFLGLLILLNIAQSPILVRVRIKAASLHKLQPRLPMLKRLLSLFAYLQALEPQPIAAW